MESLKIEVFLENKERRVERSIVIVLMLKTVVLIDVILFLSIVEATFSASSQHSAVNIDH